MKYHSRGLLTILIEIVITFLHTAYAFNLPPTLEISNSSAIQDFPEYSNITAPPALPGQPVCIKEAYGEDIKEHSCWNAWTRIVRSKEPIRYGRRQMGASSDFDYLLPIRYLSDDGFCAIDIAHQKWRADQPYGWDISDSLTISDKAKSIIERCASFGIGGTVSRFSRCKLIIVLSPFVSKM